MTETKNKVFEMSILSFKAMLENDDPTITADLVMEFLADKFTSNPAEVVRDVWSTTGLIKGALARGVSDEALENINQKINFGDGSQEYMNWKGDPKLKNQARSTVNLLGTVIAAVVIDRKKPKMKGIT